MGKVNLVGKTVMYMKVAGLMGLCMALESSKVLMMIVTMWVSGRTINRMDMGSYLEQMIAFTKEIG